MKPYSFRKTLKIEKEKAWKTLCDSIEGDPWRLPYKVAMGKLTQKNPALELHQTDKLQTIVESSLFTHNEAYTIGRPVWTDPL